MRRECGRFLIAIAINKSTPPVIFSFEIDSDPSGLIATSSAEWSDPYFAERLFRKSRHQQPHLLHLPSAANRLDRQRRERAVSLQRGPRD